MDFVSEWLASLGLTSYAPWFQGNGIDSQDNLVDLAQKSAADVDKKVQEINTAHPGGVLCNVYGHGALFRSALKKLAAKSRSTSRQGALKLNQRVTITQQGLQDDNDCYGPLVQGAVGTIVDATDGGSNSRGVSYKVHVKANGGQSWWYKDSSIQAATEEEIARTSPATSPPRVPPATTQPVNANTLSPARTSPIASPPRLAQATAQPTTDLGTKKQSQEQEPVASSHATTAVSTESRETVERIRALTAAVDSEEAWLEQEVLTAKETHDTAAEPSSLPAASVELATVNQKLDDVAHRQKMFKDNATARLENLTGKDKELLQERVSRVGKLSDELKQVLDCRSVILQKVKSARLRSMRSSIGKKPTPAATKPPTAVKPTILTKKPAALNLQPKKAPVPRGYSASTSPPAPPDPTETSDVASNGVSEPPVRNAGTSATPSESATTSDVAAAVVKTQQVPTNDPSSPPGTPVPPPGATAPLPGITRAPLDAQVSAVKQPDGGSDVSLPTPSFITVDAPADACAISVAVPAVSSDAGVEAHPSGAATPLPVATSPLASPDSSSPSSPSSSSSSDSATSSESTADAAGSEPDIRTAASGVATPGTTGKGAGHAPTAFPAFASPLSPGAPAAPTPSSDIGTTARGALPPAVGFPSPTVARGRGGSGGNAVAIVRLDAEDGHVLQAALMTALQAVGRHVSVLEYAEGRTHELTASEGVSVTHTTYDRGANAKLTQAMDVIVCRDMDWDLPIDPILAHRGVSKVTDVTMI